MEKQILSTIPTLQSIALAGSSLALLKKKKKKPKDFLANASGLIVGTSLIKAESQFINGF